MTTDCLRIPATPDCPLPSAGDLAGSPQEQRDPAHDPNQVPLLENIRWWNRWMAVIIKSILNYIESEQQVFRSVLLRTT